MNKFAALILMARLVWPDTGSAAEAPIQLQDSQGASHTPLAAKDAKAIVLLFIAPDCPISNAYVPEIKRITADYAKKPIPFYLVYVDPDLTAADIKKHVEAYGLKTTALLDSKHALARKVEAKVTPQAVVLAPDGKALYRGRIDDLYLDFGKRQDHPQQRDLRNALEAILAGKPVAVKDTPAIGCFIGD
jgi:hypothetical protein